MSDFEREIDELKDEEGNFDFNEVVYKLRKFEKSIEDLAYLNLDEAFLEKVRVKLEIEKSRYDDGQFFVPTVSDIIAHSGIKNKREFVDELDYNNPDLRTKVLLRLTEKETDSKEAKPAAKKDTDSKKETAAKEDTSTEKKVTFVEGLKSSVISAIDDVVVENPEEVSVEQQQDVEKDLLSRAENLNDDPAEIQALYDDINESNLSDDKKNYIIDVIDAKNEFRQYSLKQVAEYIQFHQNNANFYELYNDLMRVHTFAELPVYIRYSMLEENGAILNIEDGGESIELGEEYVRQVLYNKDHPNYNKVDRSGYVKELLERVDSQQELIERYRSTLQENLLPPVIEYLTDGDASVLDMNVPLHHLVFNRLFNTIQLPDMDPNCETSYKMLAKSCISFEKIEDNLILGMFKKYEVYKMQSLFLMFLRYLFIQTNFYGVGQIGNKVIQKALDCNKYTKVEDYNNLYLPYLKLIVSRGLELKEDENISVPAQFKKNSIYYLEDKDVSEIKDEAQLPQNNHIIVRSICYKLQRKSDKKIKYGPAAQYVQQLGSNGKYYFISNKNILAYSVEYIDKYGDNSYILTNGITFHKQYGE